MQLRPASTVVLARDSAGGPEMLFVKRPSTMRAFAGFHAFPGGVLEPQDSTDEAFSLSTLPQGQATALMGEDAGDRPALAFYICAARELFEEVGILFADDAGGPATLSVAEIAESRRRLAAGESFAAVLASEGLRIATDRLLYRFRWIAPEALPVRFDARVFLARAGGPAVPDPAEVELAEWLVAPAALSRAEAGEIVIAPPTAATVTALSNHGSVASMIAGRDSAEPSRLEICSPIVRRLIAPNSSVMTGPGTNTYLVGTAGLAVIDPASMQRSHLSSLSAAGEIEVIIVTHHHPDHLSGAMELSQMTGGALAGSPKLAGELGAGVRPLAHGEAVEVGGVRLQTLHTPGHASDHICLWLEEERALFSGDLVLGEGTTVISPPDGDLTSYLESLDKVAALRPRRLYPGHYSPRDDAEEWIEFYRRHRADRDREIVAALRGGRATVGEIVDLVYAAYPSAVHPAAARSVQAHLERLQRLGVAVESEKRWTLTRGGDGGPPLDG